MKKLIFVCLMLAAIVGHSQAFVATGELKQVVTTQQSTFMPAWYSVPPTAPAYFTIVSVEVIDTDTFLVPQYNPTVGIGPEKPERMLARIGWNYSTGVPIGTTIAASDTMRLIVRENGVNNNFSYYETTTIFTPVFPSTRRVILQRWEYRE